LKRYVLRALALAAVGLVSGVAVRGLAQDASAPDALAALLAAYPSWLDRIDGNALVWKDGTRMTIDEGRGPKTTEAALASADIKDMLSMPYAAGPPAAPPAFNADPGRARNVAFFDKIYGDCHRHAVERNLVGVTWLPKKWGKRIQVTKVNGVADKLASVSKELDELPSKFDVFLFPSAGTYNCRDIAGTERVSAHGYGIAIDLSTRQADYWRWNLGKAGDAITYRNKIPMEIVTIFEKHGFIWGGKWYHYDTMHFEYRPELLQ
jgi:hypothetical protein